MNYKIKQIEKRYNISTKHFLKTGTLVGQVFGLLKVIEELDERCANGKQYLCECQCSAKTKCVVRAIHLKSGHTKSCGCLKSQGELKIGEILKELNINYQKEYRFSDLKSTKNRELRFDFYLPDLQVLIEYQGRQHYEAEEFFGGEEELKELQSRDLLKRNYCNKNNYSLIIISYKDYNKLNKEYLQNLIHNC